MSPRTIRLRRAAAGNGDLLCGVLGGSSRLGWSPFRFSRAVKVDTVDFQGTPILRAVLWQLEGDGSGTATAISDFFAGRRGREEVSADGTVGSGIDHVDIRVYGRRKVVRLNREGFSAWIS